MRRHVDRDAGDRAREIGPVVELEAAQIVLVGLPLAAVLADHEPRNILEHLSRPQDRAGAIWA